MQNVSSGNHIAGLDSFRGAFALLVVVFHFPQVFWGADLSLIRNGYLAVDFFFILSGFVLARGYWDRIGAPRDLARFAADRVFRLVPLHLAGVALALVVAMAHHLLKPQSAIGASGADVLSVLTLTHSLGLGSAKVLNEPSWSLSAEMIAYGLFGLVLLGTVRRPGLRLALFFLLAALGLEGIVSIGSEGNGKYLDITHLGVYRGLFGFFLGALLYRFSFLVGPIRLGEKRGTAREFLVVGLFIFAYGIVDTGTAQVLLLIPVMLHLIVVFARAEGRLSRALEAPFLLWLGKRSFAIYILHYPIQTLAKPVVTFAVARAEGIAPVLGGFVGTLALAATVWVTLLVADYAQGWSGRVVRWLRDGRLARRSPARQGEEGNARVL